MGKGIRKGENNWLWESLEPPMVVTNRRDARGYPRLSIQKKYL